MGYKDKAKRNAAAAASRFRRMHTEKFKISARMSARRWRLNLKTKALDLLGGRCVRCGFSDYRALEIDHIEPLRRTLNKIQTTGGVPTYRNVVSGGKRENLQILCANCHSIKTQEDYAAIHGETVYMPNTDRVVADGELYVIRSKYKARAELKSCEHCNAEFLSAPSEYRRFCCRPCYYDWKKSQSKF